MVKKKKQATLSIKNNIYLRLCQLYLYLARASSKHTQRQGQTAYTHTHTHTFTHSFQSGNLEQTARHCQEPELKIEADKIDVGQTRH